MTKFVGIQNSKKKKKKSSLINDIKFLNMFKLHVFPPHTPPIKLTIGLTDV